MLYISYLRVVATIAVIVLHTAAFISMDYGNVPEKTWEIATFINSGVRFCVPIFVMISGALLLGKNEEIGIFINKRMKKILIPFLFWSLFYTCWYYKDRLLSFDKDLAEIFLSNLYNGSAYHLWYLYMIIGLYAFIPILRKFTINSTKKELEYFLVLSFVVLVAGQYSIDKITSSFINFAGFVFYLVLGYYLNAHFSFNRLVTKRFSLLLYGFATIFTFVLTYYFSYAENRFNPSYTLYLTFNVVAMSAAVFLFLKSLKLRNNPVVKQIETYSFGIYFIHVIILHYLYKLFYPLTYIHTYIHTASVFIFILITSVSVLVLSYFIIYLMCKIPILRRIVM